MIPSETARATISVHAGSASVRGEVRRSGESFVNLIDGAPVGGPTGLDFSIYRLTTNIRLALPVLTPASWQVTVQCERAGSFTVVFGESDLRFEADDRCRDEVWAALQVLSRHTLSDAIESAAMLVKHCVKPPPSGREPDDLSA